MDGKDVTVKTNEMVNSEKLEFLMLLIKLEQYFKGNFDIEELKKLYCFNNSNTIMEPDVEKRKISKTGGRKNNINILERIVSECIAKLRIINLEKNLSQKIEKSLNSLNQKNIEIENIQSEKKNISSKENKKTKEKGIEKDPGTNKPNKHNKQNNLSDLIVDINNSPDFKDIFLIKVNKNLLLTSQKVLKQQFDTFKKQGDNLCFERNEQISFKKNDNNQNLNLKEDINSKENDNSIYVNLFRNKLNSLEKEKCSESNNKSSYSTQNNSHIEIYSNNQAQNCTNEFKRSSSFDKCTFSKSSNYNKNLINSNTNTNNGTQQIKSYNENVVSPSNSNFNDKLIKSKSASPNFIKQIIKDNINIDDEYNINSNMNSNTFENINIHNDGNNYNKNLMSEVPNIYNSYGFSNLKDSNQFYSNKNHEFNFNHYSSLPLRTNSGYNYGYSPGNINLRISNFKDNIKIENEISQSQPTNFVSNFNSNLGHLSLNDYRNMQSLIYGQHHQLNKGYQDILNNDLLLGKKTLKENNLEIHHINTKSVSQSEKTNSKTNFSFQEEKSINPFNTYNINSNRKKKL